VVARVFWVVARVFWVAAMVLLGCSMFFEWLLGGCYGVAI